MILIINSQNDISTDEICKWLLHYNKDFIRINDFSFITKISLDLTNNFCEIVINDSLKVDFCSIKGIFYRNGGFNYKLNSGKKITQFLKDYHSDEWSVLNHFLKLKIKDQTTKLIGNLFNNKVNKLEVLNIAKELKLNIPESHIISTKSDLTKLLDNKKKKWITKSIGEMKPYFDKDDLYLNYTRELNSSEKFSNFFMPSLIQERIEKKYEIRTFFIEKQFWSIAIFSQENQETEIDYRINQFSHSIPFKLPVSLEKKVLKLATKLNLNSGSIDWIFDKSGKFYFLEINPLGIFNNVSVMGNYNIEREIAKML